MWGWLRSKPPNQPFADDPSLTDRLEKAEASIRRLTRRADELDVEWEAVSSKLALAAKRAYKREWDEERKGARDDVVNSPELTRAAQKASLRARMQARET